MFGQALGGRIGITSNFGSGSSFALSLPLTLAVVDGMIVTVGDQTFVIPLGHIVESLRPTDDGVKVLGPTASLLDVRGSYVPVHRVAEQLGIAGAQANPAQAVLIVVESDTGQAVLMVDTIQDQRQVVVKSLETNYAAIPGIAGATILGDGRVALILDVDALISRWRRDPRLGAAPLGATPLGIAA
jgi:two-component system chemotaxis sensor kinase CheA